MLNKSYNKFFPAPESLSRPCFGLDISDESIKYIQLIETRNGMQVGKYGSVSIPAGVIDSGKIADQNRLKEILCTFRNKQNIKYARASLPEEQVYLFKVKVPKEGSENIREMIELSFEQYVPIPPAEVVFDYELYSEDKDVFEVEVTAIPSVIIEKYLNVFENCNLDIPSFELEAQALSRAVIKDGDKDTYMIVDFGNHRTGISVVSQGMVVFTSTVDVGGSMLTNLIQKNFNIPFEEAEKMKVKYGLTRNTENHDVFSILLNGVSILRDEISKHFLYWHTHKDENGKEHPPIKKIILCGGDSNLIGFTEYLSIGMKQTVELADVWTNVTFGGDYVPSISFEDSLSYGTAIGLALADFVYE